MAVRWAVSSSNWSTGSTWNDGATLGIPVAGDDVWTNNNNVTIDQSFTVNSLNNSARARDIATPAMTANNAPSPYVAAASGTGLGSAFQAFNRNYNTGADYWGGTFTAGWVSMDFGSGSNIVIDGYTIYGTNTQASNPRNWTLESSDDNTNWTIRHTVSGAAAIAASSTYSVASIGNTTGSRYYRLNISLNGGGANLGVTELELYQRFTGALAAGGSFIFNSGSISGSATSTTAALTAGATNLIQVTATTGSVGLTLGSDLAYNPATNIFNIISHTGNCDFQINGDRNFSINNSGFPNLMVLINKTSTGTITIRGNLLGGSGASSGGCTFSSNNGNTVIIGRVDGGTRGGPGLNQTAGNVTVIGNVTGNGGIGISLTGAASQFTIVGNVTGGIGANIHGINFTGTSGSVTGTVTGGAGSNANGINTSGVVTVTGNVNGGTGGAGILPTANTVVIGNVTAGTGNAIGTTSNININITGTVTATVTGMGINMNSAGTVNLTGNMINVSGRQAIYSQNLFISNAATTQWRLFTQGGQDKTLYSADTFPNQPSAINVRSGSLFGPANALSGSMVVPIPSNVRVGVLTDNTVGTGQSLTAADFLAAISSSADPFAERLRNVATVDTVGSLVTGLNGGF